MPPISKTRVIIDTDPGVDDANALIFALLCDQLQIEAITTVHGNVDVDTGTKNALYIVEQLGRRDIPVYRGAARPLSGSTARDATVLHGKDGLGNTGIAAPTVRRRPENAVAELIRRVLADPGEITLLVLGPQTNIALAVLAEPDFAAAVKEIIFMGGRITPYVDTNPFVTFNIGEDPEAAHIVLRKINTPVTMLGQESAFQVVFTPENLDRFERTGTTAGRLAASISRYYVEAQMEIMGIPGGNIPDVAVPAYALRPELFETERMRVDVDTSDGISRGVTVSGPPSYLQLPGNPLDLLLRNRDPLLRGGTQIPMPKAELSGQAGSERLVTASLRCDSQAIVDWYEDLLSQAG